MPDARRTLIFCLSLPPHLHLLHHLTIDPNHPTAFGHGDVIGVPVTAAPGHWAPVVGESLYFEYFIF